MDKNIGLKMLQYYRHDITNELQLVQGYLHMGNVKKAQQKMDEWMDILNEERKLIHTKATQFITWVIMFNHTYHQFRLTYEIDTEAKLKSVDSFIVDHCHEIIEEFRKNSNSTELYYVHINISDVKRSEVIFTLTISGAIQHGEKIVTHLQSIGEKNELDLTIATEDSEIICSWTYVI